MNAIFAFKKLKAINNLSSIDEIRDTISPRELEVHLFILESFMDTKEFCDSSTEVIREEYAKTALKTKKIIDRMLSDESLELLSSTLINIFSSFIETSIAGRTYTSLEAETEHPKHRLQIRKLSTMIDCPICYTEVNEVVCKYKKPDRICNTCLTVVCKQCFDKMKYNNCYYKCVMCSKVYKTSFT